MLSCSPPAGIFCSTVDDRTDLLSAQILGQEETPFKGGVFQLEIQIPDRYPFDPPNVRFLTPIYHPNIDTNGRICLDTLKLPPKGTWRPCLNISTVLMMIRVLMAEPGAEDPLMTAIWQEYKYDYTAYVEKAKQWTRLHAMGSLLKQATEKSSSKQQEIQNAVLESKLQTSSSDQTPGTALAEVHHSAHLTSNTNLTAGSQNDTLRPKKGLGLASKRKALAEWDVNFKETKMS
ncbi:ubiquitin-conjugating enzyme E2 T [Elysia marginata]|uniref:Ubiquitin-conjugating enzyme E2 T n=1 Tax=Elysia marginata TaxID=1093978 RepID=A0AAV4F6Y7_9GAST|nr:ubiquitin-conjugating enzyme E2 T [Elysia marginata]